MRFESFRQMLSYYDTNTPDAVAFVYDEHKTCTYHEFYESVEKKAEEYRQMKNTCIGIKADGSFDCVLTIFASNLAGKRIVMLEGMLPQETIQMLIEATDIDHLYPTSEGYKLSQGVPDGKDKILFFTSGTTNMSKAVVLTGRSLMSSAYNGGDKLPLKAGDSLMCMLPLSHVFGFVCSLLWGLSFGATVCLSRGVRHYVDDLSFFKPTVLTAVPSLASFLISHDLINEECKLVLIGAGDCKEEVLRAFKQKGIRVSFGYGLTETSSGVAISTSGDPYAMEVCIDDTITLAEDGEILIQAPACMMLGYYKDQKSTDAVLKDGILYTGDLGRFDEEGKLHIIGRKKEMIVLENGTKIFQPEYEEKIMRATGLKDVAIILNKGKITLVYHGDLKKKEVEKLIRPVMDNYTRDQQIIEIIEISQALPRSATGKIQRWRIQI